MPTGNGDRARPADGAAQLGGVRADFVANLGRRLAEVHRHWEALENDPGSPRARDEVRRRIHALAVRARVVGLTAMADRLDQAERSLERAATVGGIDRDDVVLFRSLFEDLPALAWHEVASAPATLGSQPPAPPPNSKQPHERIQPLAVLVVGDLNLAAALGSGDPTDRLTVFECEQTDDVSTAPSLARALAPDVIVVDADYGGVHQLIEHLAADPLTTSVPFVVVGGWDRPDQAAPFLSRGASKALAKPVPAARLRAAVADAARLPRPVDTTSPLLEGSVTELADRLADEVKRGLVDALDPRSRDVVVRLGDGADALAAVWGAVARVREVLAERSDGAVRFSPNGPVGAVPLAPWLDLGTDPLLARRAASVREPLGAPARLDGLRILVADDDPAVTWFFADLVKASGADVTEARDGLQALERAMEWMPDLIISDILMPGLDGFALCRALKQDIILRDVPVVLLSWKEDLLQRVRDLGASADGYLRKEASAAAIVRKVHELLRPRMRLEQRLAEERDVRGRLDGLTALSLLRWVGKSRHGGSAVTVRDAYHVYEVTLSDAAVVHAVRTAWDGTTRSGVDALRSLPSVASGRFHVTAASVDSDGENLADALATIVARARAATKLLSGARLSSVRRVGLAASELALDATPEPARTWLQALSEGLAPRELIASHDAPPAELERILADAASRGAIDSISDDQGNELLIAETHRVVSEADASPAAPPALATSIEARGGGPGAPSEGEEPALQPFRGPLFSDPPPNYLDAPQEGDVPTSLAEAVIREVADARGSRPPPSSRTPFLVDVQELRPRTQPPSALASGSLPPDAVVPAAEAGDAEAPTAEPSVPSTPSFPPPANAPDTAAPERDSAAAPGQDDEDEEPRASPSPPSVRARDDVTLERTSSSGSGVVSRWWPSVLLLVVVLGAVIALVKLTTMTRPTKVPASSAPSATRGEPPQAPDNSPEFPPPKGPIIEPELALPDDLRAEPGMAVIEVRPGEPDARVIVDGREAGSGDVVRSLVAPGLHEVVVERSGVVIRASVPASATRRTRVSMEGMWAP